jgi:zinc transport system ATP-binding protein
MSFIEVKNVSFSYEKKNVLDNISLNIEKGEFIGIIGPNGSGKSTLVNIMVGNLKPSYGEVLYNGRGILEIKDKSFIGYVPQKSYSFNTSFPASVKEVVSMGLYSKIGLFKRFSKNHWKEVIEALEIVDMLEYKDRLIGMLSGGQLQRIFIARALVSKPDILFLDEPATGIDIKSEKTLYELLDKLNKQEKITIIMITHNIWTITEKVSRIICMSEGKVNERCEAINLTESNLTGIYGYPIKITKHYHNNNRSEE